MNYNWTLKDAVFTKDKGKVVSTFSCGGGSTMGYKLAGFDVIGMNEIDQRMADCYIANHKPLHSYIEDIRVFKERNDLPVEFYNLDILDGSPPCSSFSITGNRDADWGKEKKFKEGQTEQVLDTLFFDFIDLANKLQPKVVVAENVKGLLQGTAKKYVRKIYSEFEKAGYYCQHFLLNSKDMGVPQRRERVFFVAFRNDLAQPFLNQKDMFTKVPKIELNFSFDEVNVSEVIDHSDKEVNLTDLYLNYWNNAKQGEPVGKFNTNKKEKMDSPAFTQVATTRNFNPLYKRRLNDIEVKKIASFPLDYDSGKQDIGYMVGMSVPPLMIYNIASEIHSQWLSKLKK